MCMEHNGVIMNLQQKRMTYFQRLTWFGGGNITFSEAMFHFNNRTPAWMAAGLKERPKYDSKV